MAETGNQRNLTKGEKTKYRLARAMKECMKSASVEKITVTEIVETCGVTRQTFYRNFQDKYDLINWYFDRILLESFQHMGEGKTAYEGLVNKFHYIEEEKFTVKSRGGIAIEPKKRHYIANESDENVEFLVF